MTSGPDVVIPNTLSGAEVLIFDESADASEVRLYRHPILAWRIKEDWAEPVVAIALDAANYPWAHGGGVYGDCETVQSLASWLREEARRVRPRLLIVVPPFAEDQASAR